MILVKELGFKEKFGLLPAVSELVVSGLIDEVDRFAELMKHDPDEARSQLDQEIKWLEEHKDFLGRLVRVSVDVTLELFEEKLTYKDYVTLRYMLLKGVLVILQGINYTLQKQTGE